MRFHVDRVRRMKKDESGFGLDAIDKAKGRTPTFKAERFFFRLGKKTEEHLVRVERERE